ncbi:MAG: hypothetical protein ACR2OX_06060 [Methyloligellaceae bacterium]
MTMNTLTSFDDIEARIDNVSSGSGVGDVTACSGELVAIGEEILSAWIVAHGSEPTLDTKEGFRLIALHRQGCKGDPSFNACRETCRELAYHHNLITGDPDHPETEKRLRMAGMVARHLCLFVGGKMQVAELGEFCCSSRPLRANGG